MIIAIIGTRGVPNHYGGFEQFAEYMAKYLVDKGHEVVVYNSHFHPYKDKEWNGVKLVHKFDPENIFGTAGQFVYDLNCILDSRQHKYDVILQLGYTSSSVWGKLLPKCSIVVTNMDGLEWKRTKYNKIVRKFLLFAEKLGVKYCDHLVSDSIGIQSYLRNKYKVESTYIPYGAHVIEKYSENDLKEFNLNPWLYNLLIARLEPENSIEIILDGFVLAASSDLFVVVGNHKTKYGHYLKKKYKNADSIKFIGSVYDIEKLNNLRFYSKIYFHGHTVGGTNPSLLEAMGSGAYICANANTFNRSILGDDALYFSSSQDVKQHLVGYISEKREDFIKNNYKKVHDCYTWDLIVSQYETLFYELAKRSNAKNS